MCKNVTMTSQSYFSTFFPFRIQSNLILMDRHVSGAHASIELNEKRVIKHIFHHQTATFIVKHCPLNNAQAMLCTAVIGTTFSRRNNPCEHCGLFVLRIIWSHWDTFPVQRICCLYFLIWFLNTGFSDTKERQINLNPSAWLQITTL